MAGHGAPTRMRGVRGQARGVRRAPGRRVDAGIGRLAHAHDQLARRPPPRAASWAPSSTRWGSVCINVRSFRLAGSPSAALTTTIARPRESATARSLVAVGKPAPPCPRSPAWAICSISGDSPRPPAAARGGGDVAVDGQVLVEAHRARAAGMPASSRGSVACGQGSPARLQRRARRPEGLPRSSAGSRARRARARVPEQRGRGARAPRPFRPERSAGQPQQQEQRERPPAPASAAPRPRCSGQPSATRTITAREHRQPGRRR